MSAKHHKIRVGISIGDFNGIGPEIIIKTLKEKSILDFFHSGYIWFRETILLPEKKNVFKVNQNYHLIQQLSQLKHGEINILNLWKDNVNIEFGKPTEESTAYGNSVSGSSNRSLDER